MIFNIGMIGGQVQPNTQPELSRLSRAQQTRGPAFGSNIFFRRRNEVAGACAVNHAGRERAAIS